MRTATTSLPSCTPSVQTSSKLALQHDLDTVARIDAVPRILEVVCRTTGLRFAAVARVTEDRWVACAVRDEIEFGLVPGGELSVETTICDSIRNSGQLVVIDHVAEDPAYRDHPTPAMYGFQSYISVPIVRADGSFFGTLCAIDPKPARLRTPQITQMFELFAELIATHLDAQDRMTATESALVSEREVAQLREQFIAVLGHDLRAPLASIDAGAALLQRKSTDPETIRFASLIRRSVTRMAGLIGNVLDLAQGRLGGGLAVTPVRDVAVDEVIELIVAEANVAWPDRMIVPDVAVATPIDCDARRIGQLIANLLDNALKYGDPAQPVRLGARSDAASFELTVANASAPIPPATIARLFHPFTRAGHSGQEGLGLGLYIAAEVARAHGGSLDVTSTGGETRFTFRMPVRNPAATVVEARSVAAD